MARARSPDKRRQEYRRGRRERLRHLGLPTLSASFRESNPCAAGGPGQAVSRTLVVAQVPISLVLLSGAGLFVRSLENLRTRDLGFQPDNLLVMTIEPALAGYKDARLVSLYQEILERVKNIPGVRTASLARFGLIGAGFSGRKVTIPGFTARDRAEGNVACNAVGPRFFETSGIPMLAGRDFSPDTASSSRAAIAYKRFARFYFGDAGALGKRAVGGPQGTGSSTT